MKSSKQKSTSSRPALESLLEEKRLRQLRLEKAGREKLEHAAARPTPATSPGPAGHAAPPDPDRAANPGNETPLETWQRKRRQVKNLSAGQVANMLDGLTPDGYDRDGRKASFTESNKAFSGSRRGLSGY